MTLFIKLGGSLITDKTTESSFRDEHVRRAAVEIGEALGIQPDMRLLVGHGSGSFGHFAASRYDTILGVHSPDQWHGFAEVARAAAELNHRVAHVLADTGLPVWQLQPSASAVCHDGQLHTLAVESVKQALAHGLIPLVYGDVALDTVRGGTIISTETIFTYLAHHIPVKRILLLGEVPGVLDEHGQIIPRITPANLDRVRDKLGGSAGTDVTGGMISKVLDMLTLAQDVPGLDIFILDGRQPGLVKRALTGLEVEGTIIHAS